MARFLFWSDLHGEFAPFDIPVPRGHPDAMADAPACEEIDAVLIAGDSGVKLAHVELARKVWDIWRCPVLLINGNHEGYGYKRMQRLWQDEAAAIERHRAMGADIEILNPGMRIIAGTRIIGATLWTDMALWGDAPDHIRRAVGDSMNDYRRCQWLDERRGIFRKMIPADTIALHRRDRAYILDELMRPFSGRTIVMTHHLPIPDMLPEGVFEARQANTLAYASDLRAEILPLPIDAWICGHVHDAREVTLQGAHGAISFLSNPRGYPEEWKDQRFNPLRILDTDHLRPQQVPGHDL